MSKLKVLSLAAGVTLLSYGALATGQDAPISFQRLNEKTLIVKTGDVYPDQVVAIAAEKGLVLIDAGISPTLTREYRKIIARELGRDDFAWVVNTHHHFDHTNGNQVFPEAVIVGADCCPEAMRRFEAGIEDFLPARKKRYTRRAGLLRELDPSSKMAARLRDLVFTSRMMCDDLESDFVLTPPSLTFNDRLTLDLGDLSLRLFYFGDGYHTDNDVIAFVPELGLVFSGDLIRDYESTSSVTSDGEIGRWIAVLNELLENEIEHVISIHAGILPPERLVSKRDALARIQRDMEINTSGAALLKQVIERLGGQQAVQRVRRIRQEKGGLYYFLEGDLNVIAYTLVDENRLNEAIEVFELIVEWFPESVDALDGLGSAYLKAGDQESAIGSFKRSLELYPVNSGAYDLLMLAQTRR